MTGNKKPDWAAIRAEFPTTEKFVYLDIARKAILPRRVETALSDWMHDIYDEAGAQAFSMQGIEDTRATVADVFGAPSDCIALAVRAQAPIFVLESVWNGLKDMSDVLEELREQGLGDVD